MVLPIECLVVIEVPTKPSRPVKTVIKATAAQLLQVLGEANLFVGPGLWEISVGTFRSKHGGHCSSSSAQPSAREALCDRSN